MQYTVNAKHYPVIHDFPLLTPNLATNTRDHASLFSSSVLSLSWIIPLYFYISSRINNNNNNIFLDNGILVWVVHILYESILDIIIMYRNCACGGGFELILITMTFNTFFEFIFNSKEFLHRLLGAWPFRLILLNFICKCNASFQRNIYWKLISENIALHRKRLSNKILLYGASSLTINCEFYNRFINF